MLENRCALSQVCQPHHGLCREIWYSPIGRVRLHFLIAPGDSIRRHILGENQP